MSVTRLLRVASTITASVGLMVGLGGSGIVGATPNYTYGYGVLGIVPDSIASAAAVPSSMHQDVAYSFVDTHYQLELILWSIV